MLEGASLLESWSYCCMVEFIGLISFRIIHKGIISEVLFVFLTKLTCYDELEPLFSSNFPICDFCTLINKWRPEMPGNCIVMNWSHVYSCQDVLPVLTFVFIYRKPYIVLLNINFLVSEYR